MQMKFDRRNFNRFDRREGDLFDRRNRQQVKDDGLPTATAPGMGNTAPNLIAVVEDAIQSREKSADLRESAISSRRSSVALREKVVMLREDDLCVGEELASEAEKDVLTEEISMTAREEKLPAALHELHNHRQRNRQLVEVNEQLVIASMQFQVAAEKIEKAKEEMTHLAYHDSLTNLPNRMQLYDRIEQGILFAKRRSGRLALLFLDLDRFKAINDSLGHAIGDQVLRSVAYRLKNAVRDSDTVSRHGGDEFVLLLSEVNLGEGLDQKIEQIHKMVTAPYEIGKYALDVGATIGISIFPDDGEDATTLIRNADAAMYDAKESGRNKYQYFHPTMQDRGRDQMDTESELRLANSKNEFTLFYQAQIDLQNGTLTGVEALIRWCHPIKGVLLPRDFIPIAEESGMIVPIGLWVLREACLQAKSWLDHGLEFNFLAINISAREFESVDFLENVRSVLRETGLMPCYLGLELTENILMKSIESSAAILHSLKTMGVKILIDDFGTGHFSIGYLKDFPIDAIKIDQSIIQGISSEGENIHINTLISLGENLRHRVIAEGVETEVQLAFLRQHHCAAAQGFQLGAPMLAKDFSLFLKDAKPLLH